MKSSRWEVLSNVGRHLLTILPSAVNWDILIWRIFLSQSFPELFAWLICRIFPPNFYRFHIRSVYIIRYNSLFLNRTNHTVRTVAADLRRGEHIPKMQNNIGRKSMLHVLHQLRSKDGGGGDWVPYRFVPCRAMPRGAQPGAAFSTTAVNLRQIEFGKFGSGSANNTTMGSIRLPSDF